MSRSKKDPEASRYQRLFWKSVVRHLPHHSVLAIGEQLNARQLIEVMSARRDKVLSRSVVKAYDSPQVESYQRIVDAAKLWHGTGRMQYIDSEITDIFETIVKKDALTPVRDVYAVLVGGEEMVSLSTTRLRIIARSYADMHGQGEKEKNRYGSSFWWAAYYYSLFYGLTLTKYSPHLLRNFSKWNKLSRNEDGEITWGKKVNSKAHSVWEVFGMGSDIPGNYPILFGIKRFHRVAPPPKGIREVEVRLIDPVHLSDLSHIEVPEDKVKEVEEFLKQEGFTVPIFPIELGEYVASKQPFKKLLGIS
jgi:hypothetical protein